MSELQPDLEEIFWGSKAPNQGRQSLVGLHGDSWVIMMLIMIFFLCSITAGFAAGKYYHDHIQKSELKINGENQYTWL
jgi:hypothetical protein